MKVKVKASVKVKFNADDKVNIILLLSSRSSQGEDQIQGQVKDQLSQNQCFGQFEGQ